MAATALPPMLSPASKTPRASRSPSVPRRRACPRPESRRHADGPQRRLPPRLQIDADRAGLPDQPQAVDQRQPGDPRRRADGMAEQSHGRRRRSRRCPARSSRQRRIGRGRFQRSAGHGIGVSATFADPVTSGTLAAMAGDVSKVARPPEIPSNAIRMRRSWSSRLEAMAAPRCRGWATNSPSFPPGGSSSQRCRFCGWPLIRKPPEVVLPADQPVHGAVGDPVAQQLDHGRRRHLVGDQVPVRRHRRQPRQREQWATRRPGMVVLVKPEDISGVRTAMGGRGSTMSALYDEGTAPDRAHHQARRISSSQVRKTVCTGRPHLIGQHALRRHARGSCPSRMDRSDGARRSDRGAIRGFARMT